MVDIFMEKLAEFVKKYLTVENALKFFVFVLVVAIGYAIVK